MAGSVSSQLWQEWSGQWPTPGIAVALVGIFFALRVTLPAAERGRIRAGILFCGAYLALLLALGLIARPGDADPHHHNWLRVLSILLFSFAAVIASGLVVFDLILARREVPRILRDLLHGLAYLATAAVVLTRSEVDVTKVFTASVLTTAVIGLALQETLGNIMAGLALQLERDFDIGDWIKIDDKITGRIRESISVTRRRRCASWWSARSVRSPASGPTRRPTACCGSSRTTRSPTPSATGSTTSSSTTDPTAMCGASSGTRCTERAWRSRSRR
jgi:hypothetical protein